MKQTLSYGNISPAAAVPFFKSKWGLFTLLTIGSGLYLYQRQGGSLSSLFSKVWDMGLQAREKIGSIAPSAADSDVSSMGSSATIQ